MQGSFPRRLPLFFTRKTRPKTFAVQQSLFSQEGRILQVFHRGNFISKSLSLFHFINPSFGFWNEVVLMKISRNSLTRTVTVYDAWNFLHTYLYRTYFVWFENFSSIYTFKIVALIINECVLNKWVILENMQARLIKISCAKFTRTINSWVL